MVRRSEESTLAGRLVHANLLPDPHVKTAAVKQEIELSFMPEVDFVKLAAALRNQNDTVDTVLSLGFVSPENIQAYLDNTGLLEDCIGKLAEMLIGVRIGLPDVKEGAVLSAMRNMDKVLSGLKELSLRQGAPEVA